MLFTNGNTQEIDELLTLGFYDGLSKEFFKLVDNEQNSCSGLSDIRHKQQMQPSCRVIFQIFTNTLERTLGKEWTQCQSQGFKWTFARHYWVQINPLLAVSKPSLLKL